MKNSKSDGITNKSRNRFLGKNPGKPNLLVSMVDKVSKAQLTRYTFVGVAVVLLSLFYGRITNEPLSLDSSLQRLLDLSCENGVCMKGLVKAVDRKLVAARRLEKGWKLFEVPRSMQIWTLDALRDPFIKKNLFGARHLKTQRPLTSKAFLAANLAILQSSHTQVSHDGDATKEKLREMYLGHLPTYDDFKSHHPVLLDLRELSAKFGANSYFYFMVSRRKAEIESEYRAFTNVSSVFQEAVTFEEYVAARLSTQTRTFRSTPLDERDASSQELNIYRKYLGIDLREGSSAAVALMDALNAHHEKHNVQYKYIPETKKFYLYASKDIPAGAELYTSYGDRADLYATYGFVNGDFSERTAALLAAHQIIDGRVISQNKYEGEQKKQLQEYLRYDDGYNNCITSVDTEALELKRLKYKLLLLIMNDYRKWAASLPPRDKSTSIPIDDGISPVISICRLLALTHRDYNGTAANVVQMKILEIEEAQQAAPEDFHGETYQLVLERGEAGMEFRARIWLYRLAAEKLKRWGTASSEDELNKIQQSKFNSKDWTASYVRYQEIQTLETLKLYAEHVARQLRDEDKEVTDPEDLFYRNEFCPMIL